MAASRSNALFIFNNFVCAYGDKYVPSHEELSLMAECFRPFEDYLFDELCDAACDDMRLRGWKNYYKIPEIPPVDAARIIARQQTWFLPKYGPMSLFDFVLVCKLHDVPYGTTRKSLQKALKRVKSIIIQKRGKTPRNTELDATDGWQVLHTEEDYKAVAKEMDNCTWWYYWFTDNPVVIYWNAEYKVEWAISLDTQTIIEAERLNNGKKERIRNPADLYAVCPFAQWFEWGV